jgi:hypothetical protein
MTWPEHLIDNAERLVQQLVALECDTLAAGGLATRLDVLERLVELLRLRSGRLENSLSMDELLQRNVEVWVNEQTGAMRVSVGLPRTMRIAGATDYRRHPDLHVALLLFLLHAGRPDSRIGEDLNQFILAVQKGLSPSDLETTKTGVLRIATTTRDAARALRQHGLLRDVDETRGRTWALSLLGMLAASELTKQHDALNLPPSIGQGDGHHQPGARKRLAADVEAVVRSFAHPDSVRSALSLLVDPDKNVFTSFDVVAQTLANYCSGLEQRWRAMDERRKVQSERDLKREADAMLHSVEAAIIPSRLVVDLNKSLSMRQLLGGDTEPNE